jgi:hypothetical protein
VPAGRWLATRFLRHEVPLRIILKFRFLHAQSSVSKIKAFYTMSLCRLVYSYDVSEELAASFFKGESVNVITRNPSIQCGQK